MKFGLAQTGNLANQAREESGSGHELFLLHHAVDHRLPNRRHGIIGVGPVQRDIRMQSGKQRQASHVAEKDLSARRESLSGSLQDAHQVFHAREVLDDGVQHDGVERAVESVKHICGPLFERDPPGGVAEHAQVFPNIIDGRGRQVGGVIRLALGR